MDDRDTGVAGAPHDQAADVHRRRAAHLYGLIVSGAVLATASDDFRLGRVAVVLVVTLLVSWAADGRGGPVGGRPPVLSAVVTGLLGITLIALKALLH